MVQLLTWGYIMPPFFILYVSERAHTVEGFFFFSIVAQLLINPASNDEDAGLTPGLGSVG